MSELSPFLAGAGFFAGMGLLVILLVLWSGVWKAIALWKAARNNHLAWFVVLCVINTAGILEILYIFIFSKPKDTLTPPAPPATPQM